MKDDDTKKDIKNMLAWLKSYLKKFDMTCPVDQGILLLGTNVMTDFGGAFSECIINGNYVGPETTAQIAIDILEGLLLETKDALKLLKEEKH